MPAEHFDPFAPVTDADRKMFEKLVSADMSWDVAFGHLLAARAEAYARWLASTDAGRLVATLRDALAAHASAVETLEAWQNDTENYEAGEPIKEAVADARRSLVNAMVLHGPQALALAEAAASDRAALATVTRERDEARAALRLSEARVFEGQAVALATLREALAAPGAADAPAAKPEGGAT